MDSKQRGTFPYSYKWEISEDQTTWHRQALSMSVSCIMYARELCEINTHLTPWKPLRFGMWGWGGGINMLKSAVEWDVKKGLSSGLGCLPWAQGFLQFWLNATNRKLYLSFNSGGKWWCKFLLMKFDEKGMGWRRAHLVQWCGCVGGNPRAAAATVYSACTSPHRGGWNDLMYLQQGEEPIQQVRAWFASSCTGLVSIYRKLMCINFPRNLYCINFPVVPPATPGDEFPLHNNLYLWSLPPGQRWYENNKLSRSGM